MNRFRTELKRILSNQKPSRLHQNLVDITSEQSGNKPFLTESQQRARDLDDLVDLIEKAIETVRTRIDFLRIFQNIGYLSKMKSANYNHMPSLLDLMARQRLKKLPKSFEFSKKDRDLAFELGQAWAELVLNRSRNNNDRPPAKQPPNRWR